jgi:hypothetical protein
VLTSYIQVAMRHALCKRLPEDGAYFCEIAETPGLRGLRAVLEDWITLGLAMRDALPMIDGIDIPPRSSLPRPGRPSNAVVRPGQARLSAALTALTLPDRLAIVGSCRNDHGCPRAPV